MDELINKIARNNNIHLTLAHQEMHQVPPAIRSTLMDMGIQIIGVTTNAETAEGYARRFGRFKPQWVRKYEPIYERGTVIDWRSSEFTYQEQTLMNSYLFLDGLKRFQY
jgi:hypothetical protein